jgi:hypothetical protein
MIRLFPTLTLETKSPNRTLTSIPASCCHSVRDAPEVRSTADQLVTDRQITENVSINDGER